jgi:hypothetical protein
MKYLKNRSEFLVENKISLPKPINKNEINLPINEKFDMSGGQGPMGNDINWGDSLVGRLFNSIARKLVIGVNKGRMALINKQINSAFERLLDEGKIQSSNVNKKEIETLKVSYFLERLTAAVHQGLKVKYLIELTEETIKLAEENDELQEKDLLLQQLNDFLYFLNEFDPEEGEDLDEDITGMSKEELAKGSDIETQGDGWETEGEALKGMVTMLKSLIGMINNQGTTETTKDSDSELNKMKQPIIQQLNQSKIGDIKEVKTNDGVSLQLNGKSLITFLKYDHKPNATIIIHGYNWDGKSLIALKDDEKSKPINIGSKEQSEISIIIKSLLNLIKEKNKGDSDESANKSYDRSIIIYDGNEYEFIKYSENDKISIKGKDGKIIEVDRKNVKKKVNESFIFEKSKLSGEETDANQALEKLKRQIKTLISDDKGIAITSEFLTNLSDFSKIKEKGNKNLLKKLFDKVKQRYEKVPDFDDLYENESTKKVSESFDVISDASKIETVADKIARFAKRSMQFVGENLYGTIGDLGKHLQKFNEEFGKLLNTDLKIEESVHFNDRDLYMINKKRVSSYSNFMILNESVTQRIITYYDKKVNYNKWKIENKEIVTQIDKELENVTINKLPIDPIIEIVKLINRAYKIHTVEMIPSGRKGGKVSNRTYQEYEYVGEGGGGPRPASDGGVEPGFGPFRNKSLFNQFESNLLNIIKDKRFESLFKEDVKIEGGTKPGDGKILLKFINQILDGQTLYKKGAQSRFFQEYFGFEVKDSDLGIKSTGGGSRSGDDYKDDNKTKKKKGTFIESSQSIDKSDIGKIYILENTRMNQMRYMVVITEKNDNLYFKSSGDPKYIRSYLKDYDIDNFPKKVEESAKVSVLFRTNIDEISPKIKVNLVDLEEFNRDRSSVDIKQADYFQFDKIKVLVDSDNKSNSIKFKNPEKLSTGSDDAPFTELKDKF